jgi:F-type H+-transporting ATPase subunit delta
MSINKIATRYAKSLLDLSIEQGSTDAVLSDMKAFVNMTKNRDFKLLLTSPIVNSTKKTAIFKEIFEGKTNKITSSFFNIVINKGREMYLPQIASEFVSQYKEMQGITSITITTAEKMSEENLKSIKSKLLSSSATAKELEVKTNVDSSIIGGYILEIGDNLYDASVAHRLKELRKELIN